MERHISHIFAWNWTSTAALAASRGATPFDQLVCRIEFHSMQYAGPYTPPGTQRTLVYPGNLGVFNWGGVAVDPVPSARAGRARQTCELAGLAPASEIEPARPNGMGLR